MLNFQKLTSFFKLGLLFIVALSLISCHSKAPAPAPPPPPPPPLPGNGTFLYHDGVLLGELLNGEDEAYTKSNSFLWIMSPHGYYIGVTHMTNDVYEFKHDARIYPKSDTITSPKDILGLSRVYSTSATILQPYIDNYPNEARVMDVVTNNDTTYYIVTNYKETISLPSGSTQFETGTHMSSFDNPTSSTIYDIKTTTAEDMSINPSTPITKETFNKEFPQGWSTGNTGYEIKDAEGTFIRDWKA